MKKFILNTSFLKNKIGIKIRKIVFKLKIMFPAIKLNGIKAINMLRNALFLLSIIEIKLIFKNKEVYLYINNFV